MSLRINRNLGPFTTGAQSIFALKQWLCTSHPGTKHWTVVASGDGLSAHGNFGDPTPDVITHSGSGANGLDNANAWIVLEDPDSNRQIMFQRGSWQYAWNGKYSRGCLFTGGNATTPPTASDGKNYIGARLTGGTLFPNGLSWYLHICCEGDTPDGNVYPVWMIGRVTGTAAVATLFFMDCVVDSLSPAADDDKIILCWTYENAYAQSQAYLTYGCYYGYGRASGYLRYGEANEEWNAFSYLAYLDINAIILPGPLGPNPEDAKFAILPVFIARLNGVVNGVKGQSNLIRWKPNSSLSYGDVVYDGTEYYLVVDEILLRGWPDGTGPTI